MSNKVIQYSQGTDISENDVIPLTYTLVINSPVGNYSLQVALVKNHDQGVIGNRRNLDPFTRSSGWFRVQ